MSDAKTRLQSSPFYEEIKEELVELMALAKELYQDGKISLRDAQVLIRHVVDDARKILDKIDRDDLVQRRQVFVDICVTAWEDLGRPIKLVPDITIVPEWLEKSLEDNILDPMIHRMVESAAEFLYDYMADSFGAV